MDFFKRRLEDERKMRDVRDTCLCRLKFLNERLEHQKEQLFKLGLGAKDYNESWNEYAAACIEQTHVSKLADIILNRKSKDVENYIRFVIYQIENSTDKLTLEYKGSTVDPILDGKKSLYDFFKILLSLIEENFSQKSHQ